MEPSIMFTYIRPVKCHQRYCPIDEIGNTLAYFVKWAISQIGRNTCIGSNQGSKLMGCTIVTSFRDICFFLTFGQHLEESFSFFSRTVLIRTKGRVALLDQETLDFIPPANLNPVERVECASGEESIIPRSRTSTNLNDSVWAALSHRIGECVVSIYPIAFLLEADILSTRCHNDDMTCVTFWKTLKQ